MDQLGRTAESQSHRQARGGESLIHHGLTAENMDGGRQEPRRDQRTFSGEMKRPARRQRDCVNSVKERWSGINNTHIIQSLLISITSSFLQSPVICACCSLLGLFYY
ncbi:hypothetical protein ACOMHN_001698 [Nucella lapillus]